MFREIKFFLICTPLGGGLVDKPLRVAGSACSASGWLGGSGSWPPLGHRGFPLGLLLGCTRGLMALILVKLNGRRQFKVRCQCLLVVYPGEGTGDRVCPAFWVELLNGSCVCTDVPWASGVVSLPHL